MANRWLSNDYAVIYGAEHGTNGSSGNGVIHNIENIRNSKQARDNISREFLTVVDRDEIYEKCGANHNAIIEFWNSSLAIAAEKTKGKSKGMILFSAPESYFKNNQHCTFMMFEEGMGRTFPTNTGMICWYLGMWLTNLSLASIIRILTSHNFSIQDGWVHREWTEKEIIDTVIKGIDRKLGEDSAILLFQTMKTVHKLNQDVIVSEPVVFEGTLRRIGGEESGDTVVDSIREEFVKRLC